MIGATTRLLRNPALSQLGAEVEQHLDAWFNSCDPMGVAELIDEASISLLESAYAKIGGCEGTVWLADRAEQHLVAVANSGSDASSLVGFEQPIGSGIISMVYSQQQPYCENAIQASEGHDDTLDRKIAKHTTAMIAVPFYFSFKLRGVLSCVQLQEAGNPQDGFNSTHVDQLVRASNIVERLIDGRLLSSTLGLSDVG
jgi:hypothetical protein